MLNWAVGFRKFLVVDFTDLTETTRACIRVPNNVCQQNAKVYYSEPGARPIYVSQECWTGDRESGGTYGTLRRADRSRGMQ